MFPAEEGIAIKYVGEPIQVLKGSIDLEDFNKKQKKFLDEEYALREEKEIERALSELI